MKLQKKKYLIYIDSNEYNYEHDGWFFIIKGTEVYDLGYEKTKDSYLLYFLDDGTCIRLAIDGGGEGSAIMTHLIYKEGTGYEWVSKEKFLAHHNFNFSDPKFEKVLLNKSKY